MKARHSLKDIPLFIAIKGALMADTIHAGIMPAQLPGDWRGFLPLWRMLTMTSPV